MESTSLQDFSATTWNRFHELEVCQMGGNYNVRYAEISKDVGILDVVTADILKSLCQRPQIVHTAVLDASALPKHSNKKKPQYIVVDISINLSGPKDMIDDVGTAVTNASGFLQHPCFLPVAMPYINPHYFYPSDARTDLAHLVGPPTEDTGASELAQGLGDVLNCLDESDWSSSLASTLSEAEGKITTALKSHQKEGVISILKREEGGYTTFATNILKSYIGTKDFKSHLSPLAGGIVADVMGLGKSLTMLSAVVCSMPSAAEFSLIEMDIPTTRATLIVATSPQVMGVWKSEIERHIKPDTLRLCIFHGSNRAKKLEDIVDNDVVLTTYHTLVADWKSQRLLQGIMWFRVVLDEAHWIRNTTSQQFKATRDLKAQRRWCLSGTPIQNTLDDLRSLLDFLHFEPFSEPGFFRKHIIEPLHVNSLDPFRNLRLLLRITCFRRTAELLCLPPHETSEIAVSLTDMEMQLYDGILDRCKEEFEEISYGKSPKKRYTVLFAATMKLRRLCNHGTFKEPQHSPGSETPKRKGKVASRKQTGKVSDEPMCAYCYGDNADISADMGALEVCPECSRVLDQGTAPRSPLNGGNTTLDPTSAYQPSQGMNLPNIAQGGDTGYSSKLNAVVDNIRSSPSSKHLVFTSWRLTLNLLQLLLAQQEIPNSRIDGQTSFAEREVILQRFSREDGPGVMLLSIATGAVGLTLTVADRVHIVEPQWNPSVEEQAIGRALRIGQQRNVTVYKYIAKRTVEENIVFLQKRKSHLAKISFDGQAGSQGEEKLD
ncbi:DNA repair protein RAD5B, partial [Apiospora sp. TS-2023a]